MIEKQYEVIQPGATKSSGMAGEYRATVYGNFEVDFIEERLLNLCDPNGGIQTGPFGSQLHQKDYVSIGTPIVTVEHLGENRLLHQDVPCISDEDKARLSKYTLRKGDIVFSRVGSVDRRALVRGDEYGWLFSGRCLRVRPDPKKIDPCYLSYFFGLPSFKEHIRAIAVGATMPSLNTEILSNVVVLHPHDLSEQRAIAHILGTLDDKIELNRKMNETLEAMAQALFKSWFVDFDPVRAKAESRDPGLPKPIADLFPDSFVDSELGEIPKGWRVGTLNDLCMPGLGGDWGQDDKFDDAVKVRCLRGVDLEHLRHSGWANAPLRWINRSSLEKRQLNKRAVLIAGSGAGPLGRPVWVADELIACYDEPVIYSNFCKRIDTSSPIVAVYIDRLLHNMRETGDIWEYSTGTSVPNLDVDGLLHGRNVVISPDGLMDRFYKIIQSIYGHLFNRESRTLAALRDTLLPKLLSGELRIKDIEKFTKELP